MEIHLAVLKRFFKGDKANTVFHTIEFTFQTEIKTKYHQGDIRKLKRKSFELDDAIANMTRMLESPNEYFDKRYNRYLDDWNNLLDELIYIKSILEEEENETEC